jgi:iron complex outermembrane receptor protein
LGIDYGFFNNRITGSINYFDKESTDLLADIAVPDGANLRNQFFNVGSVRTKGVEFSIESDIVKKNLNWNVAFNTTFIDQKIAGLGITVPSFQGYGGGIAGGRNKFRLTLSDMHQILFVYEQLYDADQRPIQGAYVDRNADGK